MVCTKSKLLINCIQGFIISTFLFVQTAVKLRNSQFTEIVNLDMSWIIPISFKFLYTSLVNT